MTFRSNLKMGGDGFTLTTTFTHLGFHQIGHSTRIPKCQIPNRFKVQCTSSIPELSVITEKIGNAFPLTGGAWDFRKSTISLAPYPLDSPKKVIFVRHGLSSWNLEGRVQGSSDESVLTSTGIKQAERCREALSNMHFDRCFSSPISRAKSTAEILWQGREDPVVFLESLKEAHLFFLEGMKNGTCKLNWDKYFTRDEVECDKTGAFNFFLSKREMSNHVQHLEAEDAKERYPKEYMSWREDPVNFNVNGIYPLRRLWGSAAEAWTQILSTPGESFLVITHKSILRALVCTALGLGPERFRAIDVNNGGLCVFNFNVRGEAMLQSMNMTAHIYSDLTYMF